MADEFTKTLGLPPIEANTPLAAVAQALTRINEILYGRSRHPRAFVMGGSVAVAGGTLAIPITHSLVLKTTGGVEALTLADGKRGQLLTIVLAVDGGNGTLTPTTCSGFSTIVFGDALDSATLLYVDDATGWILVGLSGDASVPTIT